MVPVVPVIAVINRKPISKETAGSQQPGNAEVSPGLAFYIGGTCWWQLLLQCFDLLGGWWFLSWSGVIPASGFMEQTSSEFHLVTIAVHDCRDVVGQMAAGRKKKGFGRCINLSLMLVLPWEDVVLHLICFFDKFLHICLFSKTNQRS